MRKVDNVPGDWPVNYTEYVEGETIAEIVRDLRDLQHEPEERRRRLQELSDRLARSADGSGSSDDAKSGRPDDGDPRSRPLDRLGEDRAWYRNLARVFAGAAGSLAGSTWVAGSGSGSGSLASSSMLAASAYRIVTASPALVARDVELDYEFEQAIAEILRQGDDPADARRAAVQAGAIFGAVRATMEAWFSSGCTLALPSLGVEAFELLAAGVGSRWRS